MDGNCKNRRDVCGATEAGYIEYPGLPQGCAIKSGCQLSPMRTSRYCVHRTPRISAMESLQDPDTASEMSQLPCQGIVKFIIGKKVTRNTTYYQVAPTSTDSYTLHSHVYVSHRDGGLKYDHLLCLHVITVWLQVLREAQFFLISV